MSEVLGKMRIEVEAPANKVTSDLRKITGEVTRTGQQIERDIASPFSRLDGLGDAFDDVVVVAKRLGATITQFIGGPLAKLVDFEFNQQKFTESARKVGQSIKHFITDEMKRAGDEGLNLGKAFTRLQEFGRSRSFVENVENMLVGAAGQKSKADDFLMDTRKRLRNVPGFAQGIALGDIVFGDARDAEALEQQQRIKDAEQQVKVKRAADAKKLSTQIDDMISLAGAQTPEALRLVRARIEKRELEHQARATAPTGSRLERDLLDKILKLFNQRISSGPQERIQERKRNMMAEEFQITRTALGRLPMREKPQEKPVSVKQGWDIIKLLSDISQNTKVDLFAQALAG